MRHIDMPCTPERVWRAIEAARAGAPLPAWRDPPAIIDSLPTESDVEDPSEVNL